jgi:CheY-like chemotaxis protein
MSKILIVDDHADIRRLIHLTLGKRFDILEAEDGRSALNTIRAQRPDAVILDVMMPGELDGFQVLEQVKRDPELQSICVIMVTARGQAADYQFAIDKGANGYLIKPFSPLQLVALIQENIGS